MSTLIRTRSVIAVALLLLLLLLDIQRVAALPLKEVPIRGNEDIEVNCPNVPDFEDGTTRCEACRLIYGRLQYLAANKHLDVHDIPSAEQCQYVYEFAELKQKKNGFRHWYLPQTEEEGRERRAKSLDTSDGPTHHSKAEQATLPCASYLIKRQCESWLEKYEERIEDCLGGFARRVRRGSTKFANDTLGTCFESLCRKSDCHPTHIQGAKELERMRFMKYQGAFGADNFKYVPDTNDENLMVRNPYAKGGELERENELLGSDSEL